MIKPQKKKEKADEQRKDDDVGGKKEERGRDTLEIDLFNPAAEALISERVEGEKRKRRRVGRRKEIERREGKALIVSVCNKGRGEKRGLFLLFLSFSSVWNKTRRIMTIEKTPFDSLFWAK